MFAGNLGSKESAKHRLYTPPKSESLGVRDRHAIKFACAGESLGSRFGVAINFGRVSRDAARAKGCSPTDSYQPKFPDRVLFKADTARFAR